MFAGVVRKRPPDGGTRHPLERLRERGGRPEHRVQFALLAPGLLPETAVHQREVLIGDGGKRSGADSVVAGLGERPVLTAGERNCRHPVVVDQSEVLQRGHLLDGAGTDATDLARRVVLGHAPRRRYVVGELDHALVLALWHLDERSPVAVTCLLSDPLRDERVGLCVAPVVVVQPDHHRLVVVLLVHDRGVPGLGGHPPVEVTALEVRVEIGRGEELPAEPGLGLDHQRVYHHVLCPRAVAVLELLLEDVQSLALVLREQELGGRTDVLLERVGVRNPLTLCGYPVTVVPPRQHTVGTVGVIEVVGALVLAVVVHRFAVRVGVRPRFGGVLGHPVEAVTPARDTAGFALGVGQSDRGVVTADERNPQQWDEHHHQNDHDGENLVGLGQRPPVRCPGESHDEPDQRGVQPTDDDRQVVGEPDLGERRNHHEDAHHDDQQLLTSGPVVEDLSHEERGGTEQRRERRELIEAPDIGETAGASLTDCRLRARLRRDVGEPDDGVQPVDGGPERTVVLADGEVEQPRREERDDHSPTDDGADDTRGIGERGAVAPVNLVGEPGEPHDTDRTDKPKRRLQERPAGRGEAEFLDRGELEDPGRCEHGRSDEGGVFRTPPAGVLGAHVDQEEDTEDAVQPDPGRPHPHVHPERDTREQ